MLLLNLLLALIWVALTGQFDPLNFVAGFLISYLLLRLVQQPGDPLDYFKKAVVVFRFMLFYLWELMLANLRVALTVLSPSLSITPAVVAIPLAARSEQAISLLGNLITLTPGTLTLDVATDCSVMYVHTMYARDIDKVRLDIKKLEARVLEVVQ
jgi:multicomponent Na+:H+ antiporter subunit E